MNEFEIYNALCEMEKIAAQYSGGAEMSAKLRQVADRASTKLYRVAVIGEFKRGKSSLINALVGSAVMPTDIIPMTAVVTRMVYGEKKSIIIHYKDGHKEQKTVEELIDFATKYDAQKEKTARTISEIVVYYPSVFCRNRIEILDTPGMNDNEEMSAITLGVLGDVDAAVMVISARAPLSETEQGLIVNMIGEQSIHHIIFVVTYIDTISDDPKEQDRMIDFIRNRIKTNLFKRVESALSDEPDLISKARDILSEPDIYGVSALQAMQSFTNDDNKKLKLSRLPEFKQALLEFLTAAQSSDMRLNALDHARYLSKNLDTWMVSLEAECKEQIKAAAKMKTAMEDYKKNGRKKLIGLLKEVDIELNKKNIFLERKGEWLEPEIKASIVPYIGALAEIREDTDTDEYLYRELSKATEKAEGRFNVALLEARGAVDDLMKNAVNAYIASLKPLDTEDIKLSEYAGTIITEQRNAIETPVPCDFDGAVPECPKAVDPIEYIKSHIDSVAQRCDISLSDYICDNRAAMFSANRNICDRIDISRIDSMIIEIKNKIDTVKVNHNANVSNVRAMEEQLSWEESGHDMY